LHSVDARSLNWDDYPGKCALIVYVELDDWEALEPWLIYWQKNKEVKFIGIVDYAGLNTVKLSQKILALRKHHNIVVLKTFDSSPYALMPMEKSPAAYIIGENKIAEGPYYRYDQVNIASVDKTV
jgi:hypothetical protein